MTKHEADLPKFYPRKTAPPSTPSSTNKMAGTKRKQDEDSPGALYSNKSRSRPSVEARVDPTYGQRSAIPGLDDTAFDGDEDGLNYDEDMDALAYLRSVRLVPSTIEPSQRICAEIFHFQRKY